jgi:SNF2 family DNA or RNA helicase
MRLDRASIRAAFSETDYHRGLDYSRRGLVQDLKLVPSGDELQIDAAVQGTRLYTVRLWVAEDGMGVYCSCPQFAQTHSCKHLVAVLLEAEKQQSRSKQTAGRGQRLLELYKTRVSAPSGPEGGKQARLVPKISLPGLGEYPAFTFQVGYEKLYVVKNIFEFLENVRDEKKVIYGKSLTLCHRLENFDPQSQQLIQILMNEFPTFRTFRAENPWDLRYAYASGPLKNQITVTGDGFDRLFTLLEGQRIPLRDTGGELLLEREDPKLTLRLSPHGDDQELTIPELDESYFFGNRRSLYAVQEDRLLRCSPEFQDKLYPVLESGSSQLVFTSKNMADFCSYVLPEIDSFVTWEDPEDLLNRYLPDECTACFYFDMREDDLFAQLKFRYGEREIRAGAATRQAKGIRRDQRREQQAHDALDRYFDQEGPDGFLLRGEEEIYDFLTDTLPQFQQMGEVYVSDRLRNMQLPKHTVSVGISVSDGSITMDLDTGEFPPEELEDLYQSLLLRKKFHRLRDGRYLSLDGSAYETIAEVAHMTQLSPEELKSGSVTLPAYRALYLDSVISGQENIQIDRSAHFKSLIRQFKTVGDNDYQVPEEQRAILRPYQKLGYRWLKTLDSCHFGGILADDMGLGKTLQMIAYFTSIYPQEKRPSLVVCPTSLIFNWADEFEKFSPRLRLQLVTGTAAVRAQILERLEEGTILVTSYDLLKRDIAHYEKLNFYCCVLDEGQFIKNQSTLASKAVKRIHCQQRFVLTGTPIENRLSELWNLFDFLMPGYLFTHNRFVEKLEKPIAKQGDALAKQQLGKLVHPFILRRLKQDVLKELPPKVEHIQRVPLSEEERKTYQAMVHALKGNLDGSKLEILAALTRLRQICCDPGLCYENYTGETSKSDACLELCKTLTEEGHQILLFSQFTSMLDRLRQRLEEAEITCFTLQGSTPKDKRTQLVKQFNAGDAQVFLISLKAGGTGLNLTAADAVIHYDPWWNLAAQNQATDRAHRIGQRSSVHVYKLIAKDTIEEKIQVLQQRKGALMEILSDSDTQDPLNFSKEELLALLE